MDMTGTARQPLVFICVIQDFIFELLRLCDDFIVRCVVVPQWISSKSLATNTDITFQEDAFYLFYETKNSITMKGDIGVAKSTDKGATWLQLGEALVEDWHLSQIGRAHV